MKNLKVVSFSLYGNIPKYTIGCIHNAKLLGNIFEDWEMWVYHNDTVPIGILNKLKSLGVKLINTHEDNGFFGSLWRFNPIAENNVEIFISRDCDSRISLRDKVSVDEWTKSGKSFHIIRDHPTGHYWPINAGMWGAKGGAISNFTELMKSYLKEHNRPDVWSIDQLFLKDIIYPIAKNDLFLHDEYYNYEGIGTFIKRDRALDDFAFIGESIDENNTTRGGREPIIQRYHTSKHFSLFFSKVSQDPIAFSGDSSVEIISSESILRDSEFENALTGLDNIPLSPHFRAAVEKDLLQDGHRTLYRLTNPTIFVLTFPNGETRHFVVSGSGILLEKDDYWLKFFPFIKKQADGYRLNVSFSPRDIISSEEDFVWAPDMANFTHFLVDSLAPLAYFSQKFPELKKLPIPQFSRTPIWQDEYMQVFGEKRFFLPKEPNNGQTSFIVFRPKTLMLPVITSTLSRTLATREFVRDRWGNPEPILGVDRFPIFLTRNDHRAARVRNSKEIHELVSRLGGFSIDPSKLNSQQKLQLFNLPGIFIAEGSGTTNICVFASSDSRLIKLADFGLLHEESFMRGAWPYWSSITIRSDIIVGSDTKQMYDSALSSNIFDLNKINKLIEKISSCI